MTVISGDNSKERVGVKASYISFFYLMLCICGHIP